MYINITVYTMIHSCQDEIATPPPPPPKKKKIKKKKLKFFSFF